MCGLLRFGRVLLILKLLPVSVRSLRRCRPAMQRDVHATSFEGTVATERARAFAETSSELRVFRTRARPKSSKMYRVESEAITSIALEVVRGRMGNENEAVGRMQPLFSESYPS